MDDSLLYKEYPTIPPINANLSGRVLGAVFADHRENVEKVLKRRPIIASSGEVPLDIVMDAFEKYLGIIYCAYDEKCLNYTLCVIHHPTGCNCTTDHDCTEYYSGAFCDQCDNWFCGDHINKFSDVGEDYLCERCEKCIPDIHIGEHPPPTYINDLAADILPTLGRDILRILFQHHRDIIEYSIKDAYVPTTHDNVLNVTIVHALKNYIGFKICNVTGCKKYYVYGVHSHDPDCIGGKEDCTWDYGETCDECRYWFCLEHVYLINSEFSRCRACVELKKCDNCMCACTGFTNMLGDLGSRRNNGCMCTRVSDTVSNGI